MTRDALARSLALGSCLISTAACGVKPAPLGSLDTGSTGEPSDDGASGTTDTSASTSSGADGDTGNSVPDDEPVPVGPPKVDFLFVIDNSGSMGNTQAALASTIDVLAESLEAAPAISWRIGVTTTDVGNPWCGSTAPEAGSLELSSCLSRTGQFVFNGNPPQDVTEIACTDICSHEFLHIQPTTVDGDDVPRERPWIEGANGVTNLGDVDTSDVLRCTFPQGIAGCGFESPLEAARRAVLRSQTPGDPQFGFIRNDAHLVVVFVSDETDCSYEPYEEWIFLPEDQGGNPNRFWTDPDASAPTSAVCWNAGVECEGSIPDPEGELFETCRPANKSAAGTDVPDDEAVLTPVGQYVDLFADVLADKRATSNASVFLFGVLGVPSGYPNNPIDFRPSADPQYQSDFGIGPGCQNGDITAVPPVRQLAVIEAFDYEDVPGRQVFSICDLDAGIVYAQLLSQLSPFLGE